MVAADRISNLHEEIIHHIMSFLSFSEAIRISVLSKRLNSVWRTFPLPVIEFDQKLFEEKRKRPLDEMLDSVSERNIQKMSRFSGYTEDFLRRRGPDIFLRKFKLRTHCVFDVDRCVDYALENRVQELDIRSDEEENFCSLGRIVSINPEVFAAKSIRVLKLSGLELGIQNLILTDSLIEELSINHCDSLETVRIFSEKLLFFELRCGPRLLDIEIDSPNLQSLTFDGGNEPTEEFREINLGVLESLKSLSLRNAEIVIDLWLKENLSKLISLENLSIEGWQYSSNVQISHPRLKNFEFLNCTEEVDLEFVTPNLVSLWYSGILPSSIRLTSTSTQCEARISLTSISSTIECFVALKWVLSSFRDCKLVNLEFKEVRSFKIPHITFGFKENFLYETKHDPRLHATCVCFQSIQQVVFPEELKERWFAPMVNLKHLRVEFEKCSCSWSHVDVVAMLLQLSVCPNTLSIVQRSNSQDPAEMIIKVMQPQIFKKYFLNFNRNLEETLSKAL